MATTSFRFKLRRGTADDWAAVNPVLMNGEPGVETDTGAFKLGDGATAWNSLDYTGKRLADVLAAAADTAQAKVNALNTDVTGRYTAADTALADRITAVEDRRAIVQTIPATGTDVNTLTTRGSYDVATTTLARNLFNLPADRAGVLEVEGTSTGHVFQTYRVSGEGGGLWYRATTDNNPVTYGPWLDLLDVSGSGEGSNTLDGLADVTTNGALTGQTLVYTDGVWAPADAAAEGALVWRGDWAAGSYPAGSVVDHGGTRWIAATDGTAEPGAEPTGDPGATYTMHQVPGDPWTYEHPTTETWMTQETFWSVEPAGQWTLELGPVPAGLSDPLGQSLVSYGENAVGVTTSGFTHTFTRSGEFVFWENASIEDADIEYIVFAINGVEQHRVTSTAPNRTAFNGNTYYVQGWTRRAYPVEAGQTYTFTWAHHMTAEPVDGSYKMYFLADVHHAVDGQWTALSGQTGALAWRGDWDAATTYAPGDVVTAGGGSWVAQQSTTGDDPATSAGTPADFQDAFDGDLAAWDINTGGWTTIAGTAEIVNASWTTASMLAKRLTASGTATFTGLSTEGANQGSNIVFAHDGDASTYSAYSYSPTQGRLTRWDGTVSITLAETTGVADPATAPIDVTITKDGGAITITQVDGNGSHTLSVTDGHPLPGTGWGVTHSTNGTTSADQTSLAGFSYTPIPEPGPWGPLGAAGDGGAASLNALTDVDTTSTPPTAGQALVYDGALWTPGAGSGASETGRMVWKGTWSGTDPYIYGDVVSYDQMLWVARNDHSGATPALPGVAFSDDFARADGPIGQAWDNVEAPWGIVGGKAYVDTAGSNGGRLLWRSGLQADGYGRWTGVLLDSYAQNTSVAFGITDANNRYAVQPGNGRVYKVVDNVATEIGRVLDPAGSWATGYRDFPVIEVTRNGGIIDITIVRSGSGTTGTAHIVDDSPLPGTGWGIRHAPYNSTSYTKTSLDGFEFTPADTGAWNVLDRRWNTTSLDDVFAPTILDGQVLAWNAVAQRWEPRDVAAGGATTLDGLTDVDTTTNAPTVGQALLYSGTSWVPGAVAAGGGGSGGAVPAAGASVYRAGGNLAAASGTRALVFDTVERADGGFVVSAGSGTISVSEPGWYAVSAHARLASSISGNHLVSVSAGTDSILRGSQVSATTMEATVAGVVWLAADTVLTAEYYSSSSTTVTGGPSSYTNFRVARLAAGATALDHLTDVDTTTTAPADGQALVYTGGTWAPATVSGSGELTTVQEAIVGSTDGVNSTGTYASISVTLNVAARISLTELTFLALTSGDYTLWIDGAVVATVGATSGNAVFTGFNVDLTVGDHTVAFGRTDGTAVAARYDSVPSKRYTGEFYDFTVGHWQEVGTTYSLPLIYRISSTTSGMTLDHLTDVDTTTTAPADGQALVYTGGTWAPAAVGGGGGTLDVPWYDATAYGADPTGAADSRAAIQSAINAAFNAGGGVVYLPPGDYQIGYVADADGTGAAGGVQLRGNVWLRGDGRATRLFPSGTWATRAALIGIGDYTNRARTDNRMYNVRVSDLWLKGDQGAWTSGTRVPNACGIIFNSYNAAQNAVLEPDGAHAIHDILMWDMDTGMAIIGDDDQGMAIQRVRVRRTLRQGLVVGREDGSGGGPDNYFHSIDISSANIGGGGHAGIEVYAANVHFVQSKAWYCRRATAFQNTRTYKDGAGWYIKGVRNTYISCEAQDNGGHGFLVNYGEGTFIGCVADSNSYYDTVSGAAATNEASGFYLSDYSANTVLDGFLSFSRSSAHIDQKHGVYLHTAAQNVRVHGVAYNNAATAGAGVAADGLALSGTPKATHRISVACSHLDSGHQLIEHGYSASQVTVSSTAPTNPQVNALWVDTSGG